MSMAKYRVYAVFSLLFLSQMSFGQNDGGSNYLIFALIGGALVLILFTILSLADNLIQIEGKKAGVDPKKTQLGILPSFSNMFGKSAPNFVDPKDGFHDLKKGYDLKLVGEAEGDVQSFSSTRFAVKPTDFNGISPIPKVVVAAGDEVKAGDVLFFDKKRPEIMYCSPVSGEVLEIKRGAKRAITEVIILADKEISYKAIEAPSIDASREDLKAFIMSSGAWPMINQRPFDVVANEALTPRDIFISTFDSAPLALDNNIVVKGNEAAFQKGLDVLSKLTDGQVFLGLDGRGNAPAKGYTEATGVVKNYFAGKHPVGNVGVQMHNTAPIKGNDVVWTMNVQDVISLGKLFSEGKYDASRFVAVTGAQVKEPQVIKTFQGANIGEILANNVTDAKLRVISGDVFSGIESTMDDFLSFKDDQITVIREGDDYEAFGWLLPIKPRPSISGTFPNALFPNHKFEGETNTHGEKRAFVVTGQYESVLPMDIYPQHLMKAIMAGDIEKMEGLGINELSEEDLALCEFVCTSKMPLQSILRDGLNMMREQA